MIFMHFSKEIHEQFNFKRLNSDPAQNHFLAIWSNSAGHLAFSSVIKQLVRIKCYLLNLFSVSLLQSHSSWELSITKHLNAIFKEDKYPIDTEMMSFCRPLWYKTDVLTLWADNNSYIISLYNIIQLAWQWRLIAVNDTSQRVELFADVK